MQMVAGPDRPMEEVKTELAEFDRKSPERTAEPLPVVPVVARVVSTPPVAPLETELEAKASKPEKSEKSERPGESVCTISVKSLEVTKALYGIIVNITNIIVCIVVKLSTYLTPHQSVLRRLRNMPHTVPAASRSSPQRLPEKPHSRDRDRSRSRRRLEGRPSGLGRLQLRSAPRSHRRAADMDFT